MASASARCLTNSKPSFARPARMRRPSFPSFPKKGRFTLDLAPAAITLA